MRITISLIFLVLFWTTELVARNEPAFQHHIFDLSITPCADYHFVTWPNREPGYKQLVNSVYRPFVGANVGLAYIYRPFRYIGFSTGFNFIMFDAAMGKVVYTNYQFANQFNSFNQVNQNVQGGSEEFKGGTYFGYMSIPLLIHGYYGFNKTEVDLGAGPEFLLPLFTILKYTETSTGSSSVQSINTTQKYTAADMKRYGWLCFSMQLTANLQVKKFFYFSIGPEMKFLTIYPLKPGPYYKDISHRIDFYTGVKVGFRFGSNFYKRMKKTSKSS